MTESFAREFYRSTFGPPLPISPYLLARSGQLFETLEARRGSVHLDLSNPRTILDATISRGEYARPSKAELEECLDTLDTEMSERFRRSTTYRQFEDSERLLRDSHSGAGVPDVLSAKMLIGLGIEFEATLRMPARKRPVYNFLELYSPEISKSDLVDEISTMLFVSKLDELFYHYRAERGRELFKSITVGDLLHTISRFPSAFNRTGFGPGRFSHYALSLGIDELRDVAGEAWASYLVLALQSNPDVGDDEAVAMMRECVEIGLSFDELVPYAARLGTNAKLIRASLENNLGFDMLNALDAKS